MKIFSSMYISQNMEDFCVSLKSRSGTNMGTLAHFIFKVKMVWSRSSTARTFENEVLLMMSNHLAHTMREIIGMLTLGTSGILEVITMWLLCGLGFRERGCMGETFRACWIRVPFIEPTCPTLRLWTLLQTLWGLRTIGTWMHGSLANLSSLSYMDSMVALAVQLPQDDRPHSIYTIWDIAMLMCECQILALWEPGNKLKEF